MLHNEIGIALAKAGAFQEGLDLGLGGALALQKEFVLLETNGASQDYFVAILMLEAVIAVVKDNFDKGIDRS